MSHENPMYPFAIENGPVEIVDLPMKNGDFQLCKRLPEGNLTMTIHNSVRSRGIELNFSGSS